MQTNDVRAERRRAPLRAAVAALILGCASFALLATNSALPMASAKPPAAPTDSQGYVNSPARCDGPQTAVVIGRTPLSLIAICTDNRGHYEYRGMRLRDGALLKLPAAAMANGCFGARTEQVAYTVSEKKLLLTAGLRVIRDEPMLEFRDFRVPVVPVTAPVTKASGSTG
jgi:hypothetical protein